MLHKVQSKLTEYQIANNKRPGALILSRLVLNKLVEEGVFESLPLRAKIYMYGIPVHIICNSFSLEDEIILCAE